MEMAAEPAWLDFRIIVETRGLEFAWRTRSGQDALGSE